MKEQLRENVLLETRLQYRPQIGRGKVDIQLERKQRTTGISVSVTERTDKGRKGKKEVKDRK